jgi:hypothetical protein
MAPSNGCAHGLAHAGLLDRLGGKLRKFRLRNVRGQDIDFVFCNAERYKFGSCALGGRPRLENTNYHRFHNFAPIGPALNWVLGGIGNNQVFAGKPGTPIRLNAKRI